MPATAAPAAAVKSRRFVQSQGEVDLNQLLTALRACRGGDFTVRLPRAPGVAGAIAEAFNDLVELGARTTKEFQRLTAELQVEAERERTEKASQRARAHRDAILKSLPIAFHSRAIEPPFAPLFVSDSVEALTGFPPKRFTSDPRFGLSRIHPADLSMVTQRVSAAARLGRYSVEFRWLCADGRYRVLHDQGVVAPCDGEDPREIFGVILDATDRRSLEDQLVQARKMEAVGQLTGGVAHDFNNLLTVVLGNIDMLANRKEDGARRARRIEAVRQAAERGRDLTGQLLAFSRCQNLSPVTLDVNALIRDFAPLLRQAAGEAVTLEFALAAEALMTEIDPTQLETALLNLAVNARDAMPEGGRLQVATRREPGPPPLGYVAVEVHDTGVGMSAEVCERVFEPFFTTKEVGKGSGLGLSQVYGFVSQSNGEVRRESAEGEGAAFKLLLPGCSAPAEAARRRVASPELVGGSERVLLVEDDPTVLAFTLDVLTGLGYHVTTASHPTEALQIIRSDLAVDLLFTDVVMPGGVSGPGLARMAQDLRPGLRVLLTSGFVGESRMMEARKFPLLDKPYEAAVLASTLRRVLDPPERRPHKRATPAADQLRAYK